MTGDRISEFFYKRMEKALNNMTKDLPEQYKDEPIEISDEAKLSFIAWGDPQISALSPLRSFRVYKACRDLKNMKKPVDALVLVGDIAEYGAKCEYKMITELLRPVYDKFSNFFAVTGNHDIRMRNYKKQKERFKGFINSIPCGQAGENEGYYFSQYVNGYKFIMLGADTNSFEASYLSQKQLDWIDSELAEAKEGNKPVFIFNHQPLKHTNGLPVTFLGRGKWRGSVGNESDKLRAVFEKYDSVVYITGHLHYCTSQYSYEDCGSFKAISVPTVGVINHGSFKPYTQGYVFEVFDDKIIARSRVFGEGKYASEEVGNSTIEISLK